jgi:hypothetical protein
MFWTQDFVLHFLNLVPEIHMFPTSPCVVVAGAKAYLWDAAAAHAEIVANAAGLGFTSMEPCLQGYTANSPVCSNPGGSSGVTKGFTEQVSYSVCGMFMRYVHASHVTM